MIPLATTYLLPHPAEAVWAVLTDFPGYGAWNPGMTDGRGTAALGAAIAFTVEAPDGSGARYPIRATVTACEPRRALAWRGGTWPILVREHFFRLTPEGAGTRLVHGEAFSGLYPWWVGEAKIKRFRLVSMAMNHRLARHLAAR